ncbi:DUF1902 domain-containing protein [Lichenicola cladoniae]|uniref:DUF1902 domain-containing protein n=1 Tax=Lichenicola cladoniae TaxID=1484109 RepID=A0A6M8HLB9_9PROT|nr:DUF1902 domain-containing protein [Lichenicola cladoniae]NPD68918.1 DUF1902 domain-containing protein [Acetobacteraceae bacterium]QKE89136.1 DUF1902 domain-containing protein [Lichenicola cladoniae]
MTKFTIRAHWDTDARVWWAESEDVPGLVAEAETHEALIADLRMIVPELLMLNTPEVHHDRMIMSIISDQAEEVSYA